MSSFNAGRMRLQDRAERAGIIGPNACFFPPSLTRLLPPCHPMLERVKDHPAGRPRQPGSSAPSWPRPILLVPRNERRGPEGKRPVMHGVWDKTGIAEVWESGTDGLPTLLAVKTLKDYSLVFPGDTMEMEKCHRELWGAVRVIGPFPCPLILEYHGTTGPQRPSPPSQLRPPLPRYAAGGPVDPHRRERTTSFSRCRANDTKVYPRMLLCKSKDSFRGPVT